MFYFLRRLTSWTGVYKMDIIYILLYFFFMQWNALVDSAGTEDRFIHESKNLTDAINYCRENGGVLVGKPDIICRKISPEHFSNNLPIMLWTGTFQTFSPWISLLGCFKVRNNGTVDRGKTFQECTDLCVERGNDIFAYNKLNGLCQCDSATQCINEAQNLSECLNVALQEVTVKLFVYQVSKSSPHVNSGAATCYVQVINTSSIPQDSSKCGYSTGYTMNNNFSGIASNTETCAPTGQNKIIYYFRNVIEENARDATKEEILHFNWCETTKCDSRTTKDMVSVRERCNDTADGFFCRLQIDTTTTEKSTLKSTIYATDSIESTNGITTLMIQGTTNVSISTESGGQTAASELTTVINRISTDESPGDKTSTETETTSVKSLVVSTTLNSTLYSKISEVSTVKVSSTPDVVATTDNNSVSSETYSNDGTTVEYLSSSELFSTNDQTVTGHFSSVAETIDSTNKESSMSTTSQLTTTNTRHKISSQETSTMSAAETSTEPDCRSSSGTVAITTDDSSSVVSTTKSIDSSTEVGSTTGSFPVTFVNVDATHESTDAKPRDQSTGTVSSANPQSPNKTEKAIGVEVIAGASSGVAVLIVLIIIIVVVKKRHVKPKKSDRDDFLEKNRYNSYGGIPQSNDYHDITINNKSNTPFHDNNGYALVDRNFHSNDSVGKRTSGDIHIPRPQIENRSASIYSDKLEHVSLPSEENEGFYDHIQRGEKPRHSTTENAYGCYDEDSPYDITDSPNCYYKRCQSNYTNVQL